MNVTVEDCDKLVTLFSEADFCLINGLSFSTEHNDNSFYIWNVSEDGQYEPEFYFEQDWIESIELKEEKVIVSLKDETLEIEFYKQVRLNPVKIKID